MPVTFGPHCTYISDGINATGINTGISSITFTDQKGDTNTIGPSSAGPITDTIDYLNANLQSYGLFSLVTSDQIDVKLSENIIQSMEYAVDGSISTVNFTQTYCVELPVFSETQQASSVNSITEENIKEWATLEIVIIAVMISILTVTLIFKKL